jgi:hypothetical protein
MAAWQVCWFAKKQLTVLHFRARDTEKIEVSFVLLKKFFIFICSRLSFFFSCMSLSSRKYTLKVIKNNFYCFNIQAKIYEKTTYSEEQFLLLGPLQIQLRL